MAGKGQLLKRKHWRGTPDNPTPPPDAPIITSSAVRSVNENQTLAHTITTNEPCNLAFIGGADQTRFEFSGAVLRWAGNGTKDFENPNDSDLNNTYVVQIRATSIATGLQSTQTITVTVLDVTEGGGTNVAAPNALWNGTPGTGYSDATIPVPAPPDPLSLRPSLHLLMVQFTTFSGDLVLCVTSNCTTENQDDAAGEDFTYGVLGVDMLVEGNAASQNTKSWYTGIDANGAPFSCYGYIFIVDGATAQAAHPNGGLDIYFISHPRNPAFFDNVMGPYRFYVRANQDSLFDHTLHVDFDAAADTVGVKYNTLGKALSYVAQQHWQNTEVIIDVSPSAGYHVYTSPSIARTFADSVSFTTVRCADGVTCRLRASGTGNFTVNHNCIRFKGSGIEIDYSEGNLNFGSPTQARCWFDGCKIAPSKPLFQNQGNGDPTFWLAPVGAAHYLVMTEVTIMNRARGPSNFWLIRNLKGEATGECFNNCVCIHGARVEAMDATPARIHAGNEAMRLESSSGWKAEVTLTGNGNTSRTLNIYDAADVLQGSFAISVSNPTGGAYWFIDLVNWINAQGWGTNMVAVYIDPVATGKAPGRAAFLKAHYINNVTITSFIPTSTFTKVVVPTAGAGGLVCTAVVDVHMDALQNFLAGPGTNNVDYMFLDFYNHLAVQEIFLESITGGQKNFFISHATVRPDAANAATLAWGGVVENGGMEYTTVRDSPHQLVTGTSGTNFRPTTTFWMHHNYFEGGLSWSGIVDNDPKIGTNYIKNGGPPAGTRVVGNTNGTGVSLATEFVDPNARYPLPLPGALMVNGERVGAFENDGSWNGAP